MNRFNELQTNAIYLLLNLSFNIHIKYIFKRMLKYIKRV